MIYPQPLDPLSSKSFSALAGLFSVEEKQMSKFAARLRGRCGPDDGMTTAEYAVGTVAACAFAAVLLKVVSSQRVLDLLTSVVTHALRTL